MDRIAKREKRLKKKVNKITKKVKKLKILKIPKGSKKVAMPKVMKQYSTLSGKELMRRAAAYQHSYARSVVLPEFGSGSKIPSIFPQPTSSSHKHLTIPFTVSANGKAVIAWNPFFLAEAAATKTWLGINNSAGLNLNTVENVTGYTMTATNFGFPNNVVGSYRLVSASISVVPQMSIQTAQGTIAGGIANYDLQNNDGYNNGTAAFLFGGDLTVAANVDNLLYFKRANVTALESLRHIYFPLDPSYENYVPINKSHGNNSWGTDFFFAYYITGAPNGAAFNLDLYANYEWIPTPIAQSYMPMTSYEGTEDSSTIIKSLAGNSELVAQSGPSLDKEMAELDKYEDESFISKMGGYAKKAYDFLDQSGLFATALSLI